MSVVREPAVAGLFYPADSQACERALTSLFADLPLLALGGQPVGGLVPHAGWAYSGRLAAMTVGAVSTAAPDVVVVFGAVHVRDMNRASVFDRGVWRSPVGHLDVDEEFGAAILGRDVIADAAAHRLEHSIEVVLPLLHRVAPGVKILPVMVRPGAWAVEVGWSVANRAKNLGRRAAFLASSDLTHYGPRFDFEPAGRGEAGLHWAKSVNDRRMLRLIEQLKADSIIAEAEEQRNACGAGAMAAAIAAAKAAGCGRTVELAHTTSAEVRPEVGVTDSVGYASVVFVN